MSQDIVETESIFCKTCKLVHCVCAIKKVHVEGCKFLASMRCTVSIECEHGRDCCPICDPCTCEVNDGNPYSKVNLVAPHSATEEAKHHSDLPAHFTKLTNK